MTANDLDFLGGRPARNNLETFAIGYHAGHADTVCERLPTWIVQGITDEQHRAKVPLFHDAWQLGREDAERGLRDVRDAWRRHTAGYRPGPRRAAADIDNTNDGLEIARAVAVGFLILCGVVGFGWLVAILDLVNQ